MQNNLKGTKLWGVARLDSDYPICVNTSREGAIKNLDSDYVLLVEIEVVKIEKSHTHFCDCNHICHCK